MKRCTVLATSLALAVAGGCAGSGEPLEQPVVAVGENPVVYPVSMWDRRLEGETTLLVHVNEYGGVDSAYVEITSGYPEFDSAAVTGVLRLQFTPGRRGGHAVSMWTRLPIRFALDATATLGTPAAPAGGGRR